MANFGFGGIVRMPFDDAVTRVTEELQKEGFGVLTDIDVAATMKKKLDVDRPPYRILGACNPKLAHQVLELDARIGLLLPCNVVVREDAGAVRVEFMDPAAVLDLVHREDIRPIAGEVRDRLQRVARALGATP